MFKQLKQSAYLLWASDMVRSLNCTHLLHWSYLMQNKAGPLTSLGSESFSCIDCAVWVFIELTPHEILLWRRVCLSRCTLGQRLNEIDLLRVTCWHFLWTSTVPHGQSSNKYELLRLIRTLNRLGGWHFFFPCQRTFIQNHKDRCSILDMDLPFKHIFNVEKAMCVSRRSPDPTATNQCKWFISAMKISVYHLLPHSQLCLCD